MSDPLVFDEASQACRERSNGVRFEKKLGRPASWRWLAVAPVLSVLVVACGSQHVSRDELTAEEEAVLSSENAHWVKWYQPEQSSSGFNLVLHNRRIPMIRDMNGRQVHSWPNVRATGRARLSRDGNLVVIGTDDQIKEYDWSGELIRTLPLANEGSFPHHDLIELESGNTLLLALDDRRQGDYLLEVDRAGRGVWEWRAIDHREAFPSWALESGDPTHVNSVHELPPNRWFDSGDERFRPGNLLVSARNLNTVFVIDKSEGSVVWQYAEGLDHQHEAIMLGKDLEPAGMIILFNNGKDDLYDFRSSKVQIVDPATGEVIWQYESEFFFSPSGGVGQPLADGRTLITSSLGGRVFEVTREGRIVWEWVPSYNPMRVERLAYDHCPQLAALTPAIEVGVTPEDYEPFVSKQLYVLDARQKKTKRRLAGARQTVVPWKDRCRRLLIPSRAWMKVEFGFDQSRLGEKPGSARFELTLEHDDGLEVLLDVVLHTASDELWQSRQVLLGEFAYESVQACFSIQSVDGAKRVKEAALWGSPVIRPGLRADEDSEAPMPVSEEERRLRRRQLEALGYVN